MSMTPQQRYMLDVFGFLKIEGALSQSELADAQAAADRYIKLAQQEPKSLPHGFEQDPNDNRRFVHGFAFDKALERLSLHPAIMPIVMELTGGRPQLTMGTLQVDGPASRNFHNEGLSLHRAGDESMPGTGPQIGTGADGRMHCNDFICFPYLDDVNPGDGGLVVLPGSHKAVHSRPADLFGQFSLDLHLGHSHPDRASRYRGTKDRSVHPAGLTLPRNSAGLPELPTGMLNVTAKAGDILMIPEALVHGALPWVPVHRLRRVLVLRYRPHTVAGPNPQPPHVLERLSADTLELTASADSEEEKAIARRWMDVTAKPRVSADNSIAKL